MVYGFRLGIYLVVYFCDNEFYLLNFNNLSNMKNWVYNLDIKLLFFDFFVMCRV